MLTITPRGISPEISQLAEAIAPGSKMIYVPVRPYAGAELNECFGNVAQVVQKCGGDRRLGWALWEWPGVMIEAEFHAIWQTGAGELIDVSPRAETLQLNAGALARCPVVPRFIEPLAGTR